MPLNGQADARSSPQNEASATAGTNGDQVVVSTNLNVVQSSSTASVSVGSAGAAGNVAVGTSVGGVSVSGDQTANGASATGTTVSVISNAVSGSNVSVTSTSNSNDGDSSTVVEVSVTTGAGSVNRIVHIDGAGRFVVRVTADDDGLPVIEVEEVGP
ncbi:MAG: hypothetical protein M3R37_05030 [Actinomycetota bacterium]|nr:hypothetical protein [Actinomycetota bacterium]